MSEHLNPQEMNPQENPTPSKAERKAERELQQQKANKRNNILYAVIAVVFVIFAAAAIIWKTGAVSKLVPAVTINGQNYTSHEVNYHVQNTYLNFVNQNADYLSYIGLDPTVPLKSQVIEDETTAEALGLEIGQTWYDLFFNAAIEQMGVIQNALDSAKAEGFVFPDNVKTQLASSMDALEETAKSGGMTANQYLKTNFNGLTKKVYSQQLERMIQYTAYIQGYQQSLVYTDEELEATYAEDPKLYDLVSYERVSVNGSVPATTDANGKTVAASDEEKAAALKEAKAKADSLLKAHKAGKDLEPLCKDDSKLTYYSSEGSSYYGDVVTEWLFDDARKEGDCEILESGSHYYVVVFHNRTRDEAYTADVRHILFTIGQGTLSQDDEKYVDEQLELAIAAKEKADAMLAEWKSGKATEESFAELAIEHSEDPGSAANGGLYEDVFVGEMVQAFNDWCFDPARQPGDTDVVETPYGAHVMYYVSQGVPHWKAQIQTNLSTAATETWSQEFSKENEVVYHDFGMSFVG